MFQAVGGYTYGPQGTTVHQHNVELSNVDMNQELSTLVEVQRAFQSCSTALQTIDALNRKAASQIGAL